MSEKAHAKTVQRLKSERQLTSGPRSLKETPANSATLSQASSSIEEAFETYCEVRSAVMEEIERVRSLLITLNLTMRSD